MTESDDPVTLAVVGAGVGIAGASGAFGGGGGSVDIPTRQAENVKRTAAPIKQLSEQAKKNKKFAASFLARGFSEPKLSEEGLLGA